MSENYDLIVIGVGGLGSAALYFAAKQGLKVLGIEQFGVAHDRGSSHGQTRIIRTAYYEHPNYVPMAKRSFELWREIEEETDVDLLHITGLLQTGDINSEVICGVRKSARQFSLPIEELNLDEIQRRWPYFQILPNHVGLFEESAGYLRVEKCVAQMTKLALRHGATYRANTIVDSWSARDANLVEVRIGNETIRSAKLIVTAGPWAHGLLSQLDLELQVVRKQQHWFQTDRHEVHQANGGCCFLMDTPEGCFYGFPQIDLLGMKVAEHSGGQAVSNADELDRQLNHDDLNRVTQFLAKNFRIGRHRLSHWSVCMYTKSRDEHFILDRIPLTTNIAFAAGLSGHGFKFAPVIGQHLVGLMVGNSNPNCEFLGLHRFGKKTTL